MASMESGLEPHDDPLPDSLHDDASIPLARPIPGFHRDHQSRAGKDILLVGQSAAAAWLDIALFVLLLLPLVVVGESAINRVFAINDRSAATTRAQNESPSHKELLVPSLCWQAGVSCAIVAGIVRFRGGTASSVGITLNGLPLNILIGLGLLATTVGVLCAAGIAIFFFHPEWLEQATHNADRLLERIPRLSPVAFAGVALMIGVYEEVVFRGFLMPRIRRGTGSWTGAVLISSAAFSLLHLADQTPLAIGVVSVLALLFSMTTIWRRSIVPAIVAHALFDYWQFLNLYYPSTR